MARTRKQRPDPSLSSERKPAAALPVEEHGLLTGGPGAALNRETLAWLMLGFFALFVLGFWLMRIPGSDQNNPLQVDRAVFGSVSALTLTGLRQEVSASPFAGDSSLVPLTLLVLTLGGSYLTLLATSLPACRVLGLPYSTGRIASAAGILVGGGTLLGGLLLLWADPRSARDGHVLSDALVQAASAVGNSGVWLGAPPRPDAITTHLVLFPLAILGGVGLPVLMDIFDRAVGRTPALSYHTRLVLTLTAAGYLLGVILLLGFDDRFYKLLLARLQGSWTSSDSRTLRNIIISASALSFESRSAGFPMEGVASLPRAASWILVLLMAVGASPASTAGGIKTTTLYVLGRGMRQGLRGERPAPLLGFALAWLSSFLAIVFVGYAVLLWTAPMVHGDRMLMIAVSAASNCGLSQDPLSVVQTSLYVLAIMMAAARIVPILLLWRMADRIEYAETVVG